MIQINCDLGEGIPEEEAIYPWIDAASIACGGHYGDEESIAKSLQLAKRNAVQVGAHPSYPDRQNFGRKSMTISSPDLIESIDDQIRRFLKVAADLAMPMDHIKFHGALYNDAAASRELASELTSYLRQNFPDACLFVPPHSETLKFAKRLGLKYRLEVFGDRGYRRDYSLRPRSEPDALLMTHDQVANQLEAILERNEISLTKGAVLPVVADTICFHGDNPGLPDFLQKIREKWWN
ncbi:LamB/YcsF family protein [Algoriphagus namhaensis]